MRLTIGTALVGTFLLVLGVINPSPASAQAADLHEEVAASIQSELDAISRESGGVVTFDSIQIELSAELLDAAKSEDPHDIAMFILRETASDSAPVDSSRSWVLQDEIRSDSLISTTSTRKTVSHRAQQSTVLPAFGIAWVNQDMSVTFTGNTINSVSLRGNSYGTGISLFAYTHISTSLEYRLNRTCLYTRMRGTFSALFKGSAISFAATVLATDWPRGGRMVGTIYQNC